MKEVAVRWCEIDGSKVNPLTAAITMARDIIAIRLCYLFGIWTMEGTGASEKKRL
jgi:dolichyl-phosphate beta-glucosyltransferase